MDALTDDHPARADVTEIRRAAARAQSMTRQLLAFSRKELFEPRPIDLNETVDSLARLLARVIGDHIALRTSTQPSLPPILVDRGQVEHTIINLAMNARDAMPYGGELVLTTSLAELEDAGVPRPMPPGR